MNAWYSTLERPPLTPPDRIFSPVWTVLYITIAVAIVLYYRSPSKRRVALTSTLLVAHLLTNFAWTYLFFGLRSPGIALADIGALDISLLALMWLFWKTRKGAAMLLLPYAAWVLFATYLNYGFYTLN